MPVFNLGKIRLNWQGTYSPTQAYNVNDCVSYDNSSLICLVANTGQLPEISPGVANSTYWNYLAQAPVGLTTKGDTFYQNGVTTTRLPIGGNGQVLTAQSSGLPAWATPSNRPDQTVFALPQTRAGHNGNGGQGTSLLFIMKSQQRLKTIGNNVNSAGLNGWNGATTVPIVPQDVILKTPLGAGEIFVGACSGQDSHYAWTNLGNVYAGGYNNWGQLGFGDTVNRPWLDRIPFFVTNNLQVTKVAVGGDPYQRFACAYFLTSSGLIYATGYNGAGELGNGTTTNALSPVRCGTLTGITDFDIGSCNGSFVYAWNAAGSLWVWGNNSSGQLGLGNTANVSTPTLSTLTGVAYARCSAGVATTTSFGRGYALLTNGNVWATGENTNGSLGIGNTTSTTAWTQVTGVSNVANIFVGNGIAGFVFAICNLTGANAGLTYCWGAFGWATGGCSTAWQGAAGTNLLSPTLFGGNATNAAGWAQFWTCAYGQNNCIVGQQTNGTFWYAGRDIAGHGDGLSTGDVQIVPLNFANFEGVTSVLILAQDQGTTGLTFYFLAASGGVLAAGTDTNGMCGNSVVAGFSGRAVQSIKF